MNNFNQPQNNQNGNAPFNQGQPQQFQQYPQGNMPPQGYMPPQQPKKKMKKWQIALIIVGVIIAIGVVGSAGDSDDTTPSTSVETSSTENADTKKDNGDTNTSSLVEEDKSDKKEDDKSDDESSSSEDKNNESSSVENKTDEDNVFNVGDVLDTGRLKITYQSAEDFTAVDEYFQPAEGRKVVRAYFLMENIGSSDQFVSAYDFSCYADGSAVEEYIWNSDDMLDTTTISSGRKAEGYVYYEVPINAESIEIEYETSYWTQDKAIFVVK